MSVVTVLPEACKHIKTNTTPTRSLKSMESIYSVTPTSSKFSVLPRRKINQKNNRDRNPSLVPAVSEIKQRVMSARMLRVKQLQNQIGEANHLIAELSAENRLLKSLHKRQDSALSKYESSNAELPQLLHSHAEELRMWQMRCRNLQRQNKELQMKLKQKETILLSISDQNKQLLQLNKDKNLQERSYLQERVKVLEQRCMDKENEIKLLTRRLHLESKAFKSNLNLEQQKYRDLITKIEVSDFLLVQDGNNSKKTKAKTFRNKSPSSHHSTIKSAVQVNGDKDQPASARPSSAGNAIHLPPCGNNDSTLKANKTENNLLCINNNVKLDDGANSGEIDLSKNCIDKSDEYQNGTSNHDDDDDETTVRVKNGMMRARQQQAINSKSTTTTTKISTKLSPLHTEHPSNNNHSSKPIVVDNKSDKKSISNDSELSDDDDDFQFFSNHNGTKTNAQSLNNARELLNHKMHINELEEKMKQNSLDDTNIINSNNNCKNAHQCPSYLPNKTSHSSSISSSNDDDITLRNEELSQYSYDHHTFKERGDNNAINNNNNNINNELIKIQRELRESHLNRESILDEYCETIYDDDNKNSRYSENTITRIKRIEFARGTASNSYNGDSSFSKSQSPYKANNYAKSNGHAGQYATAAATTGKEQVIGRPSKLDEKRKTRLLAVLKNIDGNGSFEN